MKKVFNKFKKFVAGINFKSPKVIIGIIIVLLALFSLIMMISYSRYTKTFNSDDLVDGIVSVAGADVELKVYIQKRAGGYEKVAYIPGTGYSYVPGKTECSSGVNLKSFDSEGIELEATKRGRCKIYFDINEDLPRVVFNVIDQKGRRYDDIPDDGYVYTKTALSCTDDAGNPRELNLEMLGNEITREENFSNDYLGEVGGICNLYINKTEHKTAVQTIKEKSKITYDSTSGVGWVFNHGYRYVDSSWDEQLHNVADYNGKLLLIIGALDIDYYKFANEQSYDVYKFLAISDFYRSATANAKTTALKVMDYDGLLDIWCQNCINDFVDILDDRCWVLSDTIYGGWWSADMVEKSYIAKWPYIYDYDTFGEMLNMTLDEAYDKEQTLDSVLSPVGLLSFSDFSYARLYTTVSDTSTYSTYNDLAYGLDSYLDYHARYYSEYQLPLPMNVLVNAFGGRHYFIDPLYDQAIFSVEDEAVYYPSMYFLRGAYFSNPDAAGTVDDPYHIVVE